MPINHEPEPTNRDNEQEYYQWVANHPKLSKNLDALLKGSGYYSEWSPRKQMWVIHPTLFHMSKHHKRLTRQQKRFNRLAEENMRNYNNKMIHTTSSTVAAKENPEETKCILKWEVIEPPAACHINSTNAELILLQDMVYIQTENQRRRITNHVISIKHGPNNSRVFKLHYDNANDFITTYMSTLPLVEESHRP